MNNRREYLRIIILPRMLRQAGMILLFLIVWVVMTNHVHPFHENLSSTLNRSYSDFDGLFHNVVRLFFQFDVVVRVLLIVSANAAALVTVSRYCSQIHSPLDLKAANRYVNFNRIYSLQLPIISIRNGSIIRYKPHHPLLTAGGPGYVIIDQNSAAVFELPNGDYRILGCSSECYRGRYYVAPFEKLRVIFDLRPQNYLIMDMVARTQDGLPVKIKDMELIYGLASTTKNRQSYPDGFAHPGAQKSIPAAIHNLTFKQANNGFSGLSAVPDQIDHTIRDLINRVPLLELFARLENNDPFPYQKSPQITTLPSGTSQGSFPVGQHATRIYENLVLSFSPIFDLQSPYHVTVFDEMNVDTNHNHAVSTWFTKNRFVKTITNRFKRGSHHYIPQVDFLLEWKSKGNWDFPAEISETYQNEGFKDTVRALVKNSTNDVSAKIMDMRVQQAIQLVQNTPIKTFQRAKSEGTDRQTLISLLLGDYLAQLLMAREDFNHIGGIPPKSLEAAITHVQNAQKILTSVKPGVIK